MVLVYVIAVIIMQYTIHYRNMLSSEQTMAYSLLCCMSQTPDSNLMQLWIFIHHNYVFTYLITIMIQKNTLCVIQFQFLYVHFSLRYNIQFTAVMQRNQQPDISMFPAHAILCPKCY